jgi:hypothetical protein
MIGGEGLRLRFGTCLAGGSGEGGPCLCAGTGFTGLFSWGYGGGDASAMECACRACRNRTSCLSLSESTILSTCSLVSFSSLFNLIILARPFLRILIAAHWAFLSPRELRLSGKSFSMREDFLRAAVRRGQTVTRGVNGGRVGFSRREERGISGEVVGAGQAPVMIDMICEIEVVGGW